MLFRYNDGELAEEQEWSMSRLQKLYLHERAMRRKHRIRYWALVLTTLVSLTVGGVAYADPDFGPGESVKGPQDPGALCHPPGHEPEAPCK